VRDPQCTGPGLFERIVELDWSPGQVSGWRKLRQSWKTHERTPCLEANEAEAERTAAHWKVHTVEGDSQTLHSAVTVPERASRCPVLGGLVGHTAVERCERVIERVSDDAGRVVTITADNGTELHPCTQVEQATGLQDTTGIPCRNHAGGGGLSQRECCATRPEVGPTRVS